MKKLTYIFFSVIIAGAMFGSKTYGMHEDNVFHKGSANQPSLFQKAIEISKKYIANEIPAIKFRAKLGVTASVITYPLMRWAEYPSRTAGLCAAGAFVTAFAGIKIVDYSERRFNTPRIIPTEHLSWVNSDKKASLVGTIASAITLPIVIAKHQGITSKTPGTTLAVRFGTYLASYVLLRFASKSGLDTLTSDCLNKCSSLLSKCCNKIFNTEEK